MPKIKKNFRLRNLVWFVKGNRIVDLPYDEKATFNIYYFAWMIHPFQNRVNYLGTCDKLSFVVNVKDLSFRLFTDVTDDSRGLHKASKVHSVNFSPNSSGAPTLSNLTFNFILFAMPA